MHVAIRADADPSIGSGHVVRCLALAEEGLALGHRVVLHSHRLPPALREWAADLSVDIVEVEEPPGSAADARLLLDTAADVHLVDGYRFGASFHDEHAAATPRPILVVVDDNREVPVTHADLVLNPGAHADGSLYADLAPDRLAIGPDHAIIRRSIAGIDPGRPDPPSGRPRRLLVSLGGGDPLGLTDRLLDAMLPFDDIEVRVTRGGLVADGPDGDIVARGEGVTAVTGDLADSLAWADLAILGAGTSLWEAAHLGLPVIAVVVADNQTATSESARKAGFALRRDGRDANAIPDTLADVRSLLFDRNRLDAMSDAGRRLIDGRGVSRVWERLEGMVTTAPGDDGISFRPLVDGDRERLFDWRNRPEVARHLFGPTPIARPDHDRWFDRLSGDRSRRSWIVEADDRPAGEDARALHSNWQGTNGAGWFPKPGFTPSRPKWIPVTPTTQKRLAKAVWDTPLTFGTVWNNSFEWAFYLSPPPDVIYFMTDGASSAPTRGMDLIQAKKGRIKIYTIGYASPANAKGPLEEIAAMTGAKSKFVSMEQIKEMEKKIPAKNRPAPGKKPPKKKK